MKSIQKIMFLQNTMTMVHLVWTCHGKKYFLVKIMITSKYISVTLFSHFCLILRWGQLTNVWIFTRYRKKEIFVHIVTTINTHCTKCPSYKSICFCFTRPQVANLLASWYLETIISTLRGVHLYGVVPDAKYGPRLSALTTGNWALQKGERKNISLN